MLKVLLKDVTPQKERPQGWPLLSTGSFQILGLREISVIFYAWPCWSSRGVDIKLWPPDVKMWLIRKEKTLMLGKTEDKRRRGGRGWDGWMASLTQRTRVWANSKGEWRTGKLGVLQFMGMQRAGHDLVTDQQQKYIRHTHEHLEWN